MKTEIVLSGVGGQGLISTGEIMCQAAEDLGFDNDICGYARISLAYAAGKRASRKFDP